jgi:thiamine biosynthesis lipoprotein
MARGSAVGLYFPAEGSPTTPMKKTPIAVLLSVWCVIVLASCHRGQAPLSRTERVLGTPCTITLYDHASARSLDACFARLREINSRMSVRDPGSELDAVNEAAGKRAVHVTDDVFIVVKRGLELAQLSNGLFDPTVGPLVRLWGVNTENARVPSAAEIKAALALVNWKDVVVDETARTIALRRPSMTLDVGGVAKGYAADEMVRILAARGVRSALVDLGGNIFAMGSKPDGAPWNIGIQDPGGPRGASIGIVTVTNRTVVTSGVYERYFQKNGKRYHHIMDTRTGYPVDNGIVSATVVADTSFAADGVTLTLLAMGPHQGLALARRMGLAAIMVAADHAVYATPEAKGFFRITDPSFRFVD